MRDALPPCAAHVLSTLLGAPPTSGGPPYLEQLAETLRALLPLAKVEVAHLPPEGGALVRRRSRHSPEQRSRTICSQKR